MNDPLPVEVRSLSHRYGDRPALDGATLSVAKGELFALLGPNGSGKTTLFRTLTTLLRPTGPGQARVFGLDVASAGPEIRRRIGVTFQSPSLDPKLTVAENLRIHGRLYGLTGSRLRAHTDESLARFGLVGRSADRVQTLSGGLQRRVEIAKSMLHEPQLLLLDEPSTGLDPAARRELGRMLRDLTNAGMTVLLTTHLMDEAEECSRIAILDGGKVVAAGAPAELRSAVGGAVITIDTASPAAVVERLRELSRSLGEPLTPVIANGGVRVEHAGGARWAAELAESLPGRIDAIHVGKPTLADAFMHYTGHRFEAAEAAETAAPPAEQAQAAKPPPSAPRVQEHA